MTIIDRVYNSSKALTLMNNVDLTAKNWLVKTSIDTANILCYNDGNITFNVNCIENVGNSFLASIGSEGQKFVESSGGKIHSNKQWLDNWTKQHKSRFLFKLNLHSSTYCSCNCNYSRILYEKEKEANLNFF